MTALSFIGYARGSHYTHTGAAVNSLCLPKNPQWASYTDDVDGYKNYIYGANYETHDLSGKWLPLHNHDVPCSLCSNILRWIYSA